MKKRRVAIYGRVSTEHLEQLSALQNQMDWYKDIVRLHPEWGVVKEYIDEGITGTSAKKREAFLQMIHDAEMGEFDLIVTREVCRFARNTVDTLIYTRMLKQFGVEVYFVNDNIWTMKSDDELHLTIMATMAQEESRKTSERVNAGLKISQEKGVMRGSKILGYDKINGTYIINEEEADTVIMIFTWYSEGYGYKAIARMLEEKGRLTAYKKKRWHSSNIAKIIANPFYIGYQVQGQTKSDGYLTQKKVKQKKEDFVYVKGNHPLFLSEELFHLCQNMREERRVILDDNSISGKQIHQKVWVKKLECECGAKFRRVKWSYSRKRKEYSYGYQCYKRLNYGGEDRRRELNMDLEDTCNSKGFAEWKVEMAVYNAIRCVYDMQSDTIISKVVSVVGAYYIEDTPSIKRTESDIKALNQQLDKLKNRLNNLIEMRADGELSKAEYEEHRKGCEVQIRKVENQLMDAQALEVNPCNTTEQKERVLKQVETFLKDTLNFTSDDKAVYDDDFVDAVISKIIAKEENIFDVYFDTRTKDLYRRQVCGNIYNRRVLDRNFPTCAALPSASNTNRRGCTGRKVLRNGVNTAF